MYHLVLSESMMHKWSSYNGIWFRGWGQFRGEMISDAEDICNILSSTDLLDIDALKSFLHELYGNFSILIESTGNNKEIIAITDNICSFPIFYTNRDGIFFISDSLQLLKEKIGLTLDPDIKDEFYSTGFSLGSRTVYKDISQMLAGELIKISNSIEKVDYYLHIHKNIDDSSSVELCRKLDQAIVNSIQRMIDSINGKTIVLFLSGGYDSKLVLSTLNRLNYRNVICVSIGDIREKDVFVAREIASRLNYRWIQIKMTKKKWRDFKKTDFYGEYFSKWSAYSTYPYLQGIIIRELLNEGVIPTDSVAVTGNSGDAIEGADVTHKFHSSIKYSKREVFEQIRYKHFMLNGYDKSIELLNRIDMDSYLKSCGIIKEFYTDEEAEEVYEYFNWRERQCKYVIADLHNYEDVLKIDWRLPLWDKEFENFWLTVPYTERYDRKLYYKYIGLDNLPSANDPTLMMRIMGKIKNIFGESINQLYKIKTIFYFFFKNDYYYVPYGLISFQELLDILKNGEGNRAPQMEGIVRIMYKFF